MTTEPNYTGMIFLLTLLGVGLLYFLVKQYGTVAVEHHRAKRRAKNMQQEDDTDFDIPTNVLAGCEEFAAIATVVHLYLGELHDEENTIMTINKVARAYSPWSSKLYSQNQYFVLNRR
ncbi:MAG: hypothetical protein LBP96_02765 [Bacteroidales bacterium]|jgi:hypothetical protein|nr:hypothetical protein [Bacteroidales bacterium]